ncbi:MAG: hypothetical protein HYX25_11200 [Candidatus Solibacter usitatus]|nr:hypothetical protein [Candidatus Solibacter usitatus]
MPFSPAAAVVLAGTLLAPAALPAAEQWIKIKSSHFELYTTAGEKKGREAILYFEQVRDFFSKILVEKKSSAGAPLRLIAFRSEKEYKPFQPNEGAVAFFLPGYDRDYIVMQSIAAEHYPVAVHEFIHMLVKRSGVEVPIWFNEGLAELYSTMRPVGKKVQVGDLIPGRLVVLRESKWLPVDVLTAVGHDSPYYNERDRAGVFYAESWALMHMLNLSPEYRPQFGKFLTLLASGLPATNAFWQAYAKTTARVLQDLQQYLRGSSFNAALFDVKLQKSDEQPDIEDAPPLESAMVLADLFALTGKTAEARQKYDSAARQFPKNWEPEAGLAELALGGKDMDDARRHFARAAELGSTNARLYYNYAMTLRNSSQDEAALIPALKQALVLDPDYQDAHHYLAYCMLQSQDYEGAVEHFTKVRQIKRAEAFQYYHGLAYANYRLDKRDAARKAAEAARKFAANAEEKTTAEEILSVINEEPKVQAVQRSAQTVERAAPPLEPAERAPSARPQEPEEEKPRRLVRRNEPPEDRRPGSLPAAPLRVEGMLRQIDCLGKTARLRVRTGQKEVALAITNPEAVVVKNAPTGTLDLACGPQKSNRLTIEYESRPDPKLGTLGAVRSIEYH